MGDRLEGRSLFRVGEGELDRNRWDEDTRGRRGGFGRVGFGW